MTKLLKAIIIYLILCAGFQELYGQSATVIRGRILDKADKSAVIGATIVEYDAEDRAVNGTITNINGDFVLKLINSASKVKVSVIGYETKDVIVNPDINQVIELEASLLELEEVVVTAQAKSTYSLTNIEDRDKASAAVRVDLSDLQDVGVVSAADALQGRVSGLDIISASGDPGSGSQIVIRGLSSMGNNQPLIVIDGVPQSRVSENFDLSSADSEDISNLINVALQDIKSIEVLKDAASTAIYGSQGADGVLIIETKKGRMGKVQFDYQYKGSLNIQPPPIPMLNGDEFIMLQLEEWHNSRGIYTVPSEIAYDRDFVDFFNYSANTDWLKEITQNGLTHDHYFSISGGGEKTRYYTSFSNVKEEGTTINTLANRFSTNINLDYFISKKLLFQVKFNYYNNAIDGNLEISGKNIREMAYIKAPNMSIWEYDSYGNLTGEYFNPINNYQGNGVTYFNPVAVAHLGENQRDENRFRNSFLLQYRINNWLIVRQTVAFQFTGQKTNTFQPYNSIGADWINTNINLARETNQMSQDMHTETQLAFTRPWKSKNHDISGALTWISDNSHSEFIGIQSSRIPTTDVQDPAIGAQIVRTESGSGDARLLGGLGSLNYKYKDKYLVQGTLRADAHSSFGANKRWGLFSGVSFGWRFSEESFMEPFKFLGESMLRVSWGTSGRQPKDVYARFASYETTLNGSYVLNPAVAPVSIQLNNLRWETITSFNVGGELSLFKDRLYVEGDIYRKLTTDILFDSYEIPYSSGFDKLKYFNAGEMTNFGWELMTDLRAVKKENWQLSLNFNISRNTNIFNKLPDNFVSEKSTTIGNGQFPQRVSEGEPIGSFFGFKYLGVWKEDADVKAYDANGNVLRDSDGNPIPLRYTDTYTFRGGDPIYADINHDGKIDLNDVVYLGDSNPLFIGGMGLNLKYKRFDFSANFHYRLGFDIINGIAIQTEGMNNRNNQSKAVLNRWRIDGQDEAGMLPRAYMSHPANNLGSDRYVENGDFVRLSSVKVGYQMSQKFCSKLGLRKANFSVSARKLFTFTNYSGQDPEISQNATNPFWIGVDNARTPPAKMITISLEAGF